MAITLGSIVANGRRSGKKFGGTHKPEPLPRSVKIIGYTFSALLFIIGIVAYLLS